MYKGLDFVLGFFGTLVIGGGLIAMTGGRAIIPVIIAALIAMVFAFASGRKFVGIGILSTLAIPLIGIGACFMTLSNL